MSPSPSSNVPFAPSGELDPDTLKTKRKRDQDDFLPTHGTIQGKKRKRAPVRVREEDEMLDLKANINTAIGKMDGFLLADHVFKAIKRFEGDLSLVEIEDKRIPASAFSDTSDWESLRKLENLSSFLDHYSLTFGKKVNTLASASRSLGSPHTLVITSAGLRAADLTRALRTYQRKDSIVAKLFAKHIKLREAIDMVQKTRIGFGVGTPLRIIDLLDSGALSSSALDRIVVDCSYIDQKRRGVLDMRETQEPLIRLLNRPELKNRYGTGTTDIQLLFY